MRPTSHSPETTTRLDCATTEGFSRKAGVHHYEYCPFCGHAVLDGDGHTLTITVPG